MEKVPHPETEAQYWLAEAAVAAIEQEDATTPEEYETAAIRRAYALGQIGMSDIIRIG